MSRPPNDSSSDATSSGDTGSSATGGRPDALLVGLRPDGDPADPEVTSAWVRRALGEGLLSLPAPGGGRTAERWAGLRAIGSVDLDVARLAEAHADAAAIRADLGGLDLLPDTDGPRLWGVWAANPPVAPLTARRAGDDVSAGWVLDGTKPWCSGAGICDAALVTAQTDGGYRMFAVDLHQPGARPVDGTWPALSMRGSDSRSVAFEAVPAAALGAPGDYLERPGFWHGAIGVAAVWLGGAHGVAAPLRAAHAKRPLHPHALAHAGAVDASLAAADALLMQSAAEIDADPGDSAGTAALVARRVRAVVETAATEVVDRVGRALGPAPLAVDVGHAKRVGDLALYLRQSHAERDLEELGRQSLEGGPRA
jgi:alkylation response protein AidB-like acyl-CoA dehydrogenase